ncbi:preprotein translocase subunit SecE [Azomonas agilis]|uniref:Protein translocase subunit SecE n=1 Tax=Azomonas agilis TaxID=116849 RepID=A0A562I046_9GAMM|nr:preprotein translocase subunit SecE [Azomonas agilis]TWH64048.1 preprotein translocase subunit SecE [Azomonas agilis]
MDIKAEAEASRQDLKKWSLVAVLVVLGVVGNHYYSDQPLLYRVIAFLALMSGCLYIAYNTVKGQFIYSLLIEAKAEIRKVVWPTRQETTQTTLIVVAVVLVMALLLWGLDSLLGWIVSMIVG